MKDLVYDIVVGILILGLLLTVAIPAFRSNGELISGTAQKVDEAEKIKAQSLLTLEKGEVTGSDVISTIRYFKSDSSVEIQVTIGGITKTYVAENYQPGSFTIPYEMKFTVQNTFDSSGKLIKAIYVERP